MPEPKSRKTGEHNGTLIKLTADGVAMREQLAVLEARILRLEAELATMRKNAAAAVKTPRPSFAPPEAPRPGKISAGPPPLPRPTGSRSAVAPRRSFVDISDIAELVESTPPPAPRSRK